MDSFAQPPAVAAVWRPLTTAELVITPGLLAEALNKLRAEIPTIDAVIAADSTGLKESLAGSAVVNAVKRVLQNPDGLLSVSEAYDDYKVDTRRDAAVSTGGLYIAAEDLRALTGTRSRRWGMIPLRATI